MVFLVFSFVLVYSNVKLGVIKPQVFARILVIFYSFQHLYAKCTTSSGPNLRSIGVLCLTTILPLSLTYPLAQHLQTTLANNEQNKSPRPAFAQMVQ